MTTTSNDATTVVGNAIYLEGERTAGDKYVTQLLFTPEAKMPDGSIVQMTMYRRRISAHRPRSVWKSYGCGNNTTRLLEKHSILVASVRQDAVIHDMWAFALSTLTSFKSSYKLVGKPIVVEVSIADLSDIRLGKTPYKVLGRVWKSRKALGFPADVIK